MISQKDFFRTIEETIKWQKCAKFFFVAIILISIILFGMHISLSYISILSKFIGYFFVKFIFIFQLYY